MSNPTRRIAIAVTALALTALSLLLRKCGHRQGVPRPVIRRAKCQRLIDCARSNAFNTQDNNLLFSVFGDTGIIIDGIAPYRWLNPDAPAKWMADVDDMA